MRGQDEDVHGGEREAHVREHPGEADDLRHAERGRLARERRPKRARSHDDDLRA